MVSSVFVSMTTAMPLPDTSGEGEKAAQFMHLVLLFPPAERTVVRCLVETEHAEDPGHLVEIVLSLTEALFEFDGVQNQRDLHPLGVPARAVRRDGYVRLVNALFGDFPTHPGKPSERCHIARRRPFPGESDGIFL